MNRLKEIIPEEHRVLLIIRQGVGVPSLVHERRVPGDAYHPAPVALRQHPNGPEQLPLQLAPAGPNHALYHIHGLLLPAPLLLHVTAHRRGNLPISGLELEGAKVVCEAADEVGEVHEARARADQSQRLIGDGLRQHQQRAQRDGGGADAGQRCLEVLLHAGNAALRSPLGILCIPLDEFLPL